ncbi:MAG: hypothetical protein VKJ06_01035 [Vampirovibrionales bacterium]|nr:hypothetical protein [Vampirovibrionales bacterium]
MNNMYCGYGNRYSDGAIWNNDRQRGISYSDLRQQLQYGTNPATNLRASYIFDNFGRFDGNGDNLLTGREVRAVNTAYRQTNQNYYNCGSGYGQTQGYGTPAYNTPNPYNPGGYGAPGAWAPNGGQHAHFWVDKSPRGYQQGQDNMLGAGASNQFGAVRRTPEYFQTAGNLLANNPNAATPNLLQRFENRVNYLNNTLEATGGSRGLTNYTEQLFKSLDYAGNYLQNNGHNRYINNYIAGIGQSMAQTGYNTDVSRDGNPFKSAVHFNA